MIFENKNHQRVFNPATIQISDLKEVIYIYDI